MKKYCFFFTMLLATWIIQSCNSNTSSDSSIDSAENINEMRDSDANLMSGMDTNGSGMNNMDSTMLVSAEDAEFMVKAAAGGMADVELGKLAQQKGSNGRVKSFGAMLVKHHSAANEKLKDLAKQKNVALPASLSNDAQDDLNDLSQKSGNDFDEAYMKLMVDDHKDDVDMFEDHAKKDDVNPDLKAFINKTLPILRGHLTEAKQVNDLVNK